MPKEAGSTRFGPNPETLPGVDVDDLAWLRSAEGQALLRRARELEGSALKRGEQLRQHASPARVAAALGLLELRERAVAKFGADAARMYFTRDALEQATRAPVARHRAARLAAAGFQTAIDLGCGIGGDLIEMARAGLIPAGVDLAPLRVAMAEANLAALNLGGAVTVADATQVDHFGFDVAFADPARRTGSGRAFRAAQWQPPWDWVAGLMRRDACVKAAPGIPHDLIPGDVEAEWVSDHGEVKEAALWSGRLATTRRRATVITRGALATLTDEDLPDEPIGAGPIEQFLYEPDGAVIRAGLVQAVALGVDGTLIDPRIAWVTSTDSFTTPYARSYRVREELPWREKQLRAALRDRGIGALEIKTRGVNIRPEDLRKRLGLSGDGSATLILTRAENKGVALLADPF